MAPKRAAVRRETPEEPIEATLPGVLIPPSQAADSQREAYWIELLDNPEELRKAVGTTEFFPLLREFPQSLWGDRLSIYVYRLPDDDGMMVKNEVGARKYIKPIIRTPIDEDWIATKHGGGKYLLYLKLDNKASVKETTVRIDGPPKLQPGQTVEMDGKAVSIGTAPATAAAEPRTDVAAVIEASANANRQNTEMLLEGAKASIQLVREQATAATRPDPQNGLMDKLLTAMIERMMNPPAPIDPFTVLEKARTIFAPNPAAEAPEPKDPPLVEAMELVEKMSGGRSFADLIKGKAAAAPESAWAPFAPVALQFVTSLPTLMSEFRQTRALETQARDLAFRREVWLRTAKPGEAPPLELLASNPPAQRATQPAQPAQPQPGTPPDGAQLAEAIIRTICHGFDTNPDMGQQTAATIDLLYGKQIEALGLEKFLANEQTLMEYVKGVPPLAQRSQFATWQKFQDDFLDYTAERWGEQEDSEPEKIPGPQPVA